MPSHGTDTALQGAPPSFSSGDILFLNARIIDGSGGPSYVSTVHVSSTKNQVVSVSPALADDKVVNLAKTAGARVINAQGFALSPGFIDMHAHSDLSLLHTPLHEAKISQGVTTEVIGQVRTAVECMPFSIGNNM